MFRGVLYQRYRETRGFYYAAIWSALFFSVTHTNTVQMIYTFLLGILLCYIYEKFGSMKAPIMLHVVLNLGSLSLQISEYLTGLPENRLKWQWQ